MPSSSSSASSGVSSYPLDALRASSDSSRYPLHCTSGFYDGFSGWYAVSRSDRCADFCFWEVTASPGGGEESGKATIGGGENGTAPVSSSHYDATTTADPHAATALPNAAWRCALDVGGDSIRWTSLDLRLTPPGHFGSTFDYLRCSRGSNEVLRNAGSVVAESPSFWTGLLALSVCGAVGVVVTARRRGGWFSCTRAGGGGGGRRVQSRRGSATRIYQQASTVDGDDSFEAATAKGTRSLDGVIPSTEEHFGDEPTLRGDGDDDDDDDEAEQMLKGSPSSIPEAISRTDVKKSVVPCLRRCGIILALLSLLGLALAGAFLSVVSLVEIGRLSVYSDRGRASKLTPKCVDPSAVCEAGNVDINRTSRPAKSLDPEESDKPFSYLVASDPQLYWWDGESPLLGRANVPRPCDEERDTCGSCTAKVGRRTNRLMRDAIVNHTRSSSDENANANATVPIPSTLIMNGDLGAYFHPYERGAYEYFYHAIPGVRNYFPALGNHDYDHYDGARYGTDQWFGPANCNAQHAMGYLRGAFCGKVPGFDASRIVRYDASSLAYSWEEGRYHFVHVHYYPAYEAATIGLRSSVTWLEHDLRLAHAANLTTVLFVHSSQGLNAALERAVLGRNVKAIFAGHSHRCLMRKCFFLRALKVRDVFPDRNATDPPPNSTEIAMASPPPGSDRCVPGAYALCGGRATDAGMNLWYLANRSGSGGGEEEEEELFDLPDTELRYEEYVRPERELCRRPLPVFVNDTDNTMLCSGVKAGEEYFPTRRGGEDPEGADGGAGSKEHIPVFWSGSASFETFLKVDFYPDRFVVNAMTSSEGYEGRRFLDAYEVPSAVYPYHEPSDVEEVTIRI